MIDWDGVRYFLAVARGGSVRGGGGTPPRESLDGAAPHRAARGTPRGPPVREATIGLSPDDRGRGGARGRGAHGGVVAATRDARLRSRPGRARAAAGHAGTDPRDPSPHAGLRRVRAPVSGHRDGDPVVGRAGEPDESRGRRGDPRRLRPQGPAAQPARPERARGPRRRLRVSRSIGRVGWRRTRADAMDRHQCLGDPGLGPRDSPAAAFRSGPRTARRRSSPSAKDSA